MRYFLRRQNIYFVAFLASSVLSRVGQLPTVATRCTWCAFGVKVCHGAVYFQRAAKGSVVYECFSLKAQRCNGRAAREFFLNSCKNAQLLQAKHQPPKQTAGGLPVWLIPTTKHERVTNMNQRAMIAATAAAVLSLSTVAAHAAQAAQEREKCFGVAKAGQNDCASVSGVHSCAGQSKIDMDKQEWKYVAKGTCKELKGLSIEEAKALKKG